MLEIVNDELDQGAPELAEDLEHRVDPTSTAAERSPRFPDGCDPHGRDGTELERCVKLYLPTAVGAWRMVFEITRDPASGGLVLAYLAFGLGHPDKPWQPSAYQVARQRLHPGE